MWQPSTTAWKTFIHLYFRLEHGASMDVAGDDPRVKKILDENMMEDERIKPWIEKMDEIESNLDLQTKRLNAMIMLSTIKIEEIRLSASENGFLRHQFCFFC